MIVAPVGKAVPENERFCNFQCRYMSSLFLILGFASLAFWADVHNQNSVTTTNVASRYVFLPAQRAYQWGKRVGYHGRRIYHRDFRDTSLEDSQTLSLWGPLKETYSKGPHQRLLFLSDLRLREYDDQALETLLDLLNRKICQLRGGEHPYVIRVHGEKGANGALTGKPGLMQHFLQLSDWIAYLDIKQLLAGNNEASLACFRGETSSIILRDEEGLITGDSILVRSDENGRRWLEKWSELEQRAASQSDRPLGDQGTLMESILQALGNEEMPVGFRCDRTDETLFKACYQDIYSQLAGPYADNKLRLLFDEAVKLDPLFPMNSGCNTTVSLPSKDSSGSLGHVYEIGEACKNQITPFSSGSTLKAGYYVYLPYAGKLHYCTKEKGKEGRLFPLINRDHDRNINRLGNELSCLEFWDHRYHNG